MKLELAAAGIAAALLAASPAPARAGTRTFRGTVNVVSSKNRDAYSLVLGDRWTSTNQSVEELERIRGRYDGDFLWVRRRGTAYVVQDGEKLSEARGLFDTLRALEPQQADLESRQRLADQKEEAIDRQRDEIEDRADGAEEDDRDPSLDSALLELDAVARQVDAENRGLDAEERDLDRRSDELESAAEARLWSLVDGWIAEGSAQKASRR